MSNSKKSITVISVLVVVSLIALKLTIDHSNEPTPTNVASNKSDISNSEEVTHVKEGGKDKSESTLSEQKEHARRIIHVPGSVDGEHQEPLDSNTENTTPDNVDSMARRNLEAALDGDLEAGYYVSWVLKNCQAVPLDTALLERMIQGYTDWAAQKEREGTPIPPEGSYGGRDDLSAQFPTEAQNRKHLTRLMRGCQRLNSIFTSDLRQELSDMAERGHVLARYLYATWQPRPGLTPESWEIMQDWQLKALQYTYANLEDREAAGLLAFGQSYYSGMFTPSIFSLAITLQKAALDCGFGGSNVQSFVSENLSNPVVRFMDGSTMDDVFLMADYFADRCR